MKTYYCWRCRQEMPFLEEDEWALVAPHFAHLIKDIQQYRIENNVDLGTALREAPLQAKKVFEEITGYMGMHPNAIGHHRLIEWGPECTHCGHLLRTPLAKACLHCGCKPD